MKIDENTHSVTFGSTGKAVDCYGGMIGLSAELNVGGGYDDTIHFPDLQSELTPAEQLELADHMIERWKHFRIRAESFLCGDSRIKP